MALFNSWGPENKDQKALPGVRSTRTAVIISYPSNVYAWLVDTIETETFWYVGMTKSAAEACMAAMRQEWTKTKTVPSIGQGGLAYVSITECVADIRGVPDGGGMWHVEVDVNDKTTTIEQ